MATVTTIRGNCFCEPLLYTNFVSRFLPYEMNTVIISVLSMGKLRFSNTRSKVPQLLSGLGRMGIQLSAARVWVLGHFAILWAEPGPAFEVSCTTIVYHCAQPSWYPSKKISHQPLLPRGPHTVVLYCKNYFTLFHFSSLSPTRFTLLEAMTFVFVSFVNLVA